MAPFRSSSKLRLATLWPAVAAGLVSAILLSYLLPRLLEQSAANQLQDTLDILAPVLTAHVVGPPRVSSTELHTWVRELAGESDLRITIIDREGVVLADSSRTLEQLRAMDNHGGRPEVVAARRSGRGSSVRVSDTTGLKYAYAARLVARPDGDRWTLRLAQPLESSNVLQRNLLTTLALAGGIALLAMVAVTWWLDRRLFRPLALLIEGAGQLAAGRYRYRVDVPEEDDLATLALSLNRLAGRVEEQIAAVKEQRDHLRAILSSMAEGVLVVDRHARAVFANPAFHRIFDVDGEVEGLLPLEITRRGELAAIVESTLDEEKPLKSEVEMRSPERRMLALSSAVLAGEPGGAVVVARDITESRRLADTRRDFVANVSHELRTPLSAIRGFAETLRDGALDHTETARRFTERILEHCERLQALLNDLLILSRLESVDLPVELDEEVDLGQVVQRALEVVQPQAREKKIGITIDDGPIPTLQGNAESLERLVLNLLENAVKYNRPGGHVEIRLLSFKRPRRAGQVVLEVADDGIGIPSEALPRIFERFYRVDKGRSREEGGTGLGLAIVKHVAQVHDGRVEVESEIGQGTTFRVRLPLPPKRGSRVVESGD